MTEEQVIPATFIIYASDILGHTDRGLTGNEITRAFSAYSVEYEVHIPYSTYPLYATNKRTALSENLMAFTASQQYRIIRDLCDHPSVQLKNPAEARKLKLTLMSRYGHFDVKGLGVEVNEELIEQTRHWLDSFPEVLGLFNDAFAKYTARVFLRNLLDDLRLSLEKLVQVLLGNSKSLENQISGVGLFVKERGGSTELSNMFVKLVDYYCKYQNTYIKHDDAVIEEEVEFILEITAAFMKHFVRLGARDKV